jgi:hypothetical protein
MPFSLALKRCKAGLQIVTASFVLHEEDLTPASNAGRDKYPVRRKFQQSAIALTFSGTQEINGKVNSPALCMPGENLTNNKTPDMFSFDQPGLSTTQSVISSESTGARSDKWI